jgi:hypothetical protein
MIDLIKGLLEPLLGVALLFLSIPAVLGGIFYVLDAGGFIEPFMSALKIELVVIGGLIALTFALRILDI